MRIGRYWVVAAMAVAAVAGGCGGGASERPSPAVSSSVEPSVEPQPASPPTAPQMVAAARAQLVGLRVVERHPSGLSAYERDLFGPSWADTDGNGCNQRDDVLLRDAVPGTVVVQVQGRCSHDVLSGSWIDPYTGALLVLDDLKDPAQAQAVQIDHVVPLAEAWDSGASGWSPELREAFANDLDGLLAVDGPTNASKGASDPAAWRPRKDYQCAYAVRWILVKDRWDLGVDDSEARALEDLLGRCE